MGREETARRLRRKYAFIFWAGLRPAEAAGAHHPGSPSHVMVVAIGQRHYGSAQGLSSTSVTHIGLQRIFLNFPLDSKQLCYPCLLTGQKFKKINFWD